MIQVEVRVKMERIKACPFCGEPDNLGIRDGFGTVCVICHSCGATGPLTDDEVDAILLWNAAANQIETLRVEREEARRWARKLYRVLNEVRETYFKEW